MRFFAALCAIVALSTLTLLAQDQPLNRSTVATAYQKLPLGFEPNAGQADPRVRFLSRTANSTVLLTDNQIAVAPRLNRKDAHARDAHSHPIRSTLLSFQFVGSNPHPRIEGEDLRQGVSNYFVGSDPAKWHTNVAHYARVRYHELYPGADVVFYGNQRNLEYDVVLSPGANPDRVRFRVGGADAIHLDAKGNLILDTRQGPITAYLPRVYQNISGRQVPVDGHYQLGNDHEVAFKIAAYDRAKTLVIDPVITYETLLGGSFTDEATAIAIDPNGNAYVAGITESPDFPITPGAFDKTCGTAPDQCQEADFHDFEQFSHLFDAFVTKLNATGTGVLYSTFLGGDDADTPNAIAVDPAGNAYITGDTESTNFPGKPFVRSSVTCTNGCAFATKLNASGSALGYSVLFQNTSAGTFGVNSVGQLYLSGTTTAATFPTTAGAFQRTRKGPSDGFVAQLSSKGTSFVFSTLLGGSGDDSISDAALSSSTKNILVVGQTRSTNFPITPGAFSKTRAGGFFVAKFSPGGGALFYSTYLPSTVSELGDSGGYRTIAVDASENAYVLGLTQSTTFAVTPGAAQKTSGGDTDTVVIKLNSSGSKLLYATYYGGGNADVPVSIAVSPSGKATIAGVTESVDLPVSKDALEPELFVGPGSGFVAQLNASGTALITSTYINGAFAFIDIDDFRSSFTMTQDQFGNVYVGGNGTPFGLQPTLGAFQTTSGGMDDAFIMKIEPLCALSPTNRIVTICTPGNSATVSSPVRIVAGSTNDVHVRMMQVFVDGSLAYERDGETAVDVRLPIAAGSHRVTVQATDLNNTHFWKTLVLTVK
jgi:hypothetical protein